MTTVQKPSVRQVLTESRAAVTTTKGSAHAAIETIVTGHEQKVGTLREQRDQKLKDALTKREADINASRVAVDAAAEALRKAQAELAATTVAHNNTVSKVSAAFNQAAADIRTAIVTEELAIIKARNEALAAEKKKVADAKKAGRSAVVAEVKAAVAYDALMVEQVVYGTAAVVGAVGNAVKVAIKAGSNAVAEAFKAGVDKAPVPQTLVKRQEQKAAASAQGPQA